MHHHPFPQPTFRHRQLTPCGDPLRVCAILRKEASLFEIFEVPLIRLSPHALKPDRPRQAVVTLLARRERSIRVVDERVQVRVGDTLKGRRKDPG